MYIEIRKIPNGEQVFESEVEMDRRIIPIKLKTERNFANISCSVEYNTEIDCECSRCLESFKQKIDGNTKFFIIPNTEKSGFDDEDFDCYFYKSENDSIDFTRTIFDDVWTQVPMKPLCKEDCKGINLSNKEEKVSERKEENGQWKAALKSIKI